MNNIIYKNVSQINCIYFLGFLIIVFCLTNCSNLENNQQKKDSDQMKVLNLSQLNAKQLEDWKLFFDKWILGEFKRCLQTNNFKMDCIDCGSIYLDVQLTVDKNGKLSNLKIITEEIDCSEKSQEQIQKLSKCMLSYFEKNNYPESLKNIILETRLGKVTRC